LVYFFVFVPEPYLNVINPYIKCSSMDRKAVDPEWISTGIAVGSDQ